MHDATELNKLQYNGTHELPFAVTVWKQRRS